MQSFLVIGDLHLKEDKLSQEIFVYFWNWIKTILLPNESIIQLGDLFHRSIYPGPIIDLAIKTLQKFNHITIIQGNHDFKQEIGSLLEPLTNFKNLEIIDKPCSKNILGLKCLLLPSKSNMKIYEQLDGNYNYIFGHYASIEDSFFTKEGLDLSHLNGVQVRGHIHSHIIHSEKSITLGTPYITRFDERKNINFKILRIFENGVYQFIDVPKIFEYYTINYGDQVKSECPFFKLYIQNASSIREARQMYKDYNIYPRIELKKELTNNNENVKIEGEFYANKSLYDYFIEFDQQNPVEKNIKIELELILR